jgi:nucleoside-diphosphate-sugar epimerase
MRVFLAGATGAIGRRLVPTLVAGGHQVTGMTRSQEKAEQLRTAGAEPVVVDALDGAAVAAVVREAQPEAVIHQLTALPQRIDPRKIERDFALNDRLRSEGTRLLVAAARDAGARRVIAQSISFAYEPGPPGTIHNEQDPLTLNPPQAFKRSAQALRELEDSVLGANGIVLRYGYFYGPGTSISSTGSMVEEVARRRLPIIGRGAGVWSFIHIDDAAQATVAALEHEGPAVYNVVDDHPALVSEWVPALAQAVKAPRPWRVPTALARLIAGQYGVSVMTHGQGASNELAKRELDWQPAHASWREGFRTALG